MSRTCFFVVLACIFFATPVLAGDFKVTSTDLQVNGLLPVRHVYNGFGCRGNNISPQLSWQGEPAETKSFAVTVFDPDAPTGRGWWHWLVFNIPKNVHSLVENSGNPERGLMPAGVIQGTTDFGTKGYGGACPPAGSPSHRYQFTVWALDVEHLPLTSSVSGARLESDLNSHSLGRAELTVTYGR